MKFNGILCLLLAMFLVQACYDDEGNYKYKEVNEVTIQLPKSYFSGLVMGDPIVIKPTVTYSNPEDTGYFKHEWFLESVLVCSTPVLNATWDKLGSSYGEYRITDTLTGCRYAVDFRINQVTAYETGWMVLSEKNGKSSLCYIQDKDGEYKDFPDIYTRFNQEELGSEPIRMVEHYTSKGKNSEILIIQRGGQGCIEIDGKSLRKTVATSQEFLGETLPVQLNPVDAAYTGRVNYILNENGQLFSRKADPGAFHTHRYSPLPVVENGQELQIQFLIPIVDSRTEFTLMCDAGNRRLVGIPTLNTSKAGNLTELYIKEYPKDVIPLNDFGDNLMIYTGAFMEKVQSSDFVSIFKTPENQYKVQQFSVDYIQQGGLEISHISSFIPVEQSLFNENSLFFLLKRRPYLFFTSGPGSNSLYFLDLATKRQHLYKNFGNTKIVSMCADKYSQHLGVALEDGRFFIFDIADQLLGREVKMLYSLDNLGKIVHTIHKYGNLDNYAYN